MFLIFSCVLGVNPLNILSSTGDTQNTYIKADRSLNICIKLLS